MLYKSASFFIIYSVVIALCNANSDTLQSGSDGGFLFTVPKSVRSGKRETTCLSLHGAKAGARAEVTVNIVSTGLQKIGTLIKKSFDAENVGCFEVRIPETTDSKAKLHLQIKFSEESNYTVNSVEDVNIVQNNGVTFIQTDKEIYKPGDRVKIRILILNNDLMVPKNLTIPTVKIRNPIRIAIGQWENVTTELGIVQLEHQLSQETMQGTWVIELPGNGNVFKTFEVKEYVLPRFEIIISSPDTVYIEAKKFNFTVCSRYPYGLGIQGTAHLKILIDNFPVNQLKELKSGCANFSFDRSELPIKQYITLELKLIATVTEHGTGQILSTSKDVKLSNEKYTLQFVNMPPHFQNGIPYKGQVQITESFEDIKNKTIKICYNYGIQYSWNLTQLHCNYFTLNDKNSTDFVIFPFEENITEIKLTANIEENTTDIFESSKQNIIYYSIPQWFSPSNSFIQLSYESTSIPIKCKAWQPFTILYTLNDTLINSTKHAPIEFNYLIKSKGNIFKFGKVTHTPCSSTPFDINDYNNVLGNKTLATPKLPIDKFILTVKIHQKMFSEAQLLVYYVRNDGEVVGTSINFEVENCLANKVETSWSESQNYPGESTNFKIKAAVGSLCAVSAIDKKISFLSPTVNLNVDSLLKYVRKEYYYDAETSSKCKKDYELNEDYTNIPFWDLRRKKRFYADFSMLYDTLQVFNDNQLLVMTDLKILSRPCIYGSDFVDGEPRAATSGIYFSPEPYQTQAIDMGATIRSYFPETWLWELVTIGRTGELQLKKELPHSITQWMANTFCVSPNVGIGIAQKSNIITFKPFFIDIITPYSIKRNEISHLKVIVHNYLNHSLPVAISLGLSKHLRSAGTPDESFITFCIGPNDSSTNTFRITASALGRHNLSITAEVDSAYPGECGPEILLNRRDVIVKQILVQAEGFPFERTMSNFACTKDFTNETEEEETKKKEIRWNVEVPVESIKNSSRLKILLDADLLELTTENLGSLLDVPTGCGEQIMASLAPNFYVLRYLNETGNLTPQIKKRALNNIRIGYERILQYRHKDGSFSAFGEKYSPGSMFLTAFVLKTLSQVSGHIFIDKNIITKSAMWILDRQMENGCFSESTSHVFQSGITSESENNVALTAYVLISLIESGLPISDNVKDNAKYCLRGHSSVDKYTMSIISYALFLVKWESEAARSLEQLLEVGVRKKGLLSWEDPDSLAKSLEITSYTILSLVSMNDSEHTGLAHEAVRWLLTKRNANGGFVSTQDTVVALDALTKFAVIAKKEDTNVTVFVATGGKQFHFRMKNKAKLRTKQVTLTKFSSFVKFRVEGTGCILIQTLLRYNMPQIISSEALKLAISVNSVSTIDKCAIAQISACFSYLVLNKQINMAILELTLPSGYKADRTSLFKLTENSSQTKVEKFEEIENKVVLYFTEVSQAKICVPFLINEQMLIENRTEAIARLYDYYNPQISTIISYQLPNCTVNTINNKISNN